MEEIKFDDVCLTIDNEIANIIITREKSLNALNSKVLNQLYHCFDIVEKEKKARVIVVSGKGTKAFAAGADLKEIAEKECIDDLREYYAAFDMLYTKMSKISSPIIAKVDGYAFGGGCLLALAADLIVASKDAVFAQPEINFGFTGGAALLPRLVGKHKAAEITMLAANIKADEAYRLNIVNKVVEKDALDDAVNKMCDTLLKKDPFALGMIKKIIKCTMDTGITAANNYENECSAVCLARAESKEAILNFIK